MASPTEAEAVTQLKNAIKIASATRNFSSVNSPNFLSLEDTLLQSLETDFYEKFTSALAKTRSNLKDAVDSMKDAAEAALLTWARAITGNNVAEELTLEIAKERIYDRMVAGTQTVQRRVFTFGTITAGGSNVGDGVIKRLTKDKNNFDIEATTPEARVLICTGDAQSGTPRHRELFEFRGVAKPTTTLVAGGSGTKAPLRCLSADDSLLVNPSFEQLTTTQLVGWTFQTGTVADVSLDTTNFYRGYGTDEASTRVALTIGVTAFEIRQKLSVRGTSLRKDVPYYLRLVYNRQIASADGTLEMSLGSQTVTVALSAQTGWNVLELPLDQNSWLQNFNEDELDVVIKLSGGATPGLRIDDMGLWAGTRIDGLWYWAIGSDPTSSATGGADPFRIGDVFTWTDSCTESVVQLWLWLWFEFYLPHAASTPTYTDP